MLAQCATVQCTLSQWSLIDNSSHTIKNRPSVKSHRKQSHTPLSNQQLGDPGKNSNCTCLFLDPVGSLVSTLLVVSS